MSIESFDPPSRGAIASERRRQEEHLELIARRITRARACSPRRAPCSPTSTPRAIPGKRYYGGCEFVDIAEELAIERAKKLFGAAYANVQPHSGSQANAAVYFALLAPGDTLLGMSLDHGGHLTHGAKVNFSGKFFNASSTARPATGEIDYDAVERLAQEHRPKMIIAGFSAYSRVIDWQRFRAIADEVGAYFVVDMAHVAGLVAAGVYPNPVPHADVVTTTTHKTLRGPRGGLILAREHPDCTRS
jgi:glycine hydroxymethyltransferase